MTNDPQHKEHQHQWAIEEYRVSNEYQLEHYRAQNTFRLTNNNHDVQLLQDNYNILVTVGQNASKSIFLLAAGGCVALLSYIAQAQAHTPDIIFDALKLFSLSALIATVLAGFIYCVLSRDSYSQQRLVTINSKITPDLEDKEKEKLLLEHDSLSSKKQKEALYCEWIAIGLWCLAFFLICYAGWIVCPELKTKTFGTINETDITRPHQTVQKPTVPTRKKETFRPMFTPQKC